MKDLNLYEEIPPIKNNFQVKFMQNSLPLGLLPHWHEHIELLFFTDGSCDFFCDGKKYNVKENDLMVINSTEIHSYTQSAATTHFCILIFPEFFSDIDFSKNIKNHISKDKYIKSLFLKIKAESEDESLGSDMMIKSYTYALMSYLIRNYSYKKNINNDSDLKYTYLNLIFNYVAKKFSEKIKISDIAHACHLSEGYLCRFFKSATGNTIIDYINSLRIKKACVLLTNTSLSILEIAHYTGFCDSNYFSRIFKKQTGLTPRQFKSKKYS